MTDTKHTPGPWVVSGAAILTEAYSFDWVGSVQVSNVPEWEANARLIAKAPEMRDLLMDLFDAPGVTLRLKGNRDTVQEILGRALALVKELRGQP